MSIENNLKKKIQTAFAQLGLEIELEQVVIESTKDKNHGDYATNAALKFSSLLKKSPLEVASLLVESIDKEGLEKVELAGPGFINFFIKSDILAAKLGEIIDKKENYGNGENKNLKINIEFVSANPTGDLHLGHARNAAIGDSLARILTKAGHSVTREFYLNDAGNQIDNLGLSIDARYKQLFGLEAPMSEDMYQGVDIIQIAKTLKENHGDKYLNDVNALSFFKEYGMKEELKKINEDLEMFRVKFDVYSLESEVRSKGAIEKEIEFLKPYIYHDGEALVLKTSSFLDDKDRVIVKSDGEYTYFLPDIIYHLDKLSRGFDYLIDVLGADHHGYINRMKSALMMHGYKKDTLDVQIIQMVRIFQDGKEIKLSKRTGKTITLRELCEDVGIDAVRYFFVARSASSHLDFNLNLAREQSSSNPVYYAQYAYARLASVFEQAADEFLLDASGKLLKEESEIDLLKLLIDYPHVIEDAANKKEPSIITNFIQKLAAATHSFYTNCRIIDKDDTALTSNRLALAKATQIVLKNALNLIGVEAPNKM
ncbi:MAG: arginine--tRNA ligase [Bacilli bacterium]|jgi:arginyl-tRNA synthetase|nr:arginine--tRNA ligase [Bacilli bacterium]